MRFEVTFSKENKLTKIYVEARNIAELLIVIQSLFGTVSNQTIVQTN